MKCIKAIKPTDVEVGMVKRVTEEVAENLVKTGNWKYIPKSEYKETIGETKVVEPEVKKEPVKKQELKKPERKGRFEDEKKSKKNYKGSRK